MPQSAAARLVRFVLPVAALLALGVGLGTLLRAPGEPARGPEVADTDTRGQGSRAAFGFVVRRGDRIFAGEPGQVLHSGDVLRFTLSSASSRYAGVWGVDALGRPSPYQGGQQLALLPAGPHQPLAEAVELDDSLGEERLVAVFCSRQLPASEITAALAASPSAPQLPVECASESLAIVKAPP
jgi:hypothetical protein